MQMRIRTVKPGLFLDERLFDAERESGLPLRLAFIGLWGACDREGRFEWLPRRLGVLILPYDGLEFSRVLDALWTRGFLVRYTNGGRDFGWVPGFARHQAINNRENASELPAHDDPGSQVVEPVSTYHATMTREARVEDATSTEVQGCKAEGKGREGKGSPSDTTEREGVSVEDLNNGNGRARSQLPARVDSSSKGVIRHLGQVFEAVREGTIQRMSADDARRLGAEAVFAYWAAKVGRSDRTVLDSKREQRIMSRLREEMSLDLLFYAVDGALREPWHNGEKGEGKHLEVEHIFLDRGRVEKLAELVPGFRRSEPHPRALKLRETLNGGGES